MQHQAIISILALALAIVSCSKGPTPTEQAAQQGILLLGNGEEPNSLDPHIAASVAEAHILYSLFEGLVSPDPENPNKIAPGVASSWSYDAKKNRYTFTLRPEAQWSNGSPVTADDFKRSIQRALNPEFGTVYPEMFFDIQNAEAYFYGNLNSFESVGIKAPSEQQLEITLEKSSPHFLQKLKHFSWLPVPIDSINTHGNWKSRSTQWATQENLVSNGPFALEKWIRNSVIEVKRSDSYWDTENVTLNGVRFFPYENAQIEYRAFESNQLHVTDKIPIEALQSSNDRSLNAKSDPFLATSYLIFNTKSKSLADIRFREALARSIDKKSLVFDVNLSGTEASSFTPKGLDSYAAPRASAYDPEQARLLFEHVFPEATEAPKLSFLVSNNPASRAISVAIQSMWSETLGLEVELLNMEAKTLFSSLNAGDYDISFLSWSGDYEDPVSFLDIWKSQNSKNRARWKNTEFDALLDKASLSSNASHRMELLSQAESILLSESPIVPIIWKTKDYFIDPNISNWPQSLLDIRSYKHIRFSDTP